MEKLDKFLRTIESEDTVEGAVRATIKGIKLELDDQRAAKSEHGLAKLSDALGDERLIQAIIKNTEEDKVLHDEDEPSDKGSTRDEHKIPPIAGPAPLSTTAPKK